MSVPSMPGNPTVDRAKAIPAGAAPYGTAQWRRLSPERMLFGDSGSRLEKKRVRSSAVLVKPVAAARALGGFGPARIDRLPSGRRQP
jgi:hypothetical protein